MRNKTAEMRMSAAARASRLLLAAGLIALAGCMTSSARITERPSRHQRQFEQLRVHSDFELPPQHRLMTELVALRGQVAWQLALPMSDEPLHVYLFDTADRFGAFLREHHPDFPDRRAFFFETDTELMIYAHWGDRVAEDLRHEVVHGYLHAAVPNLPLWLDEGLAEYYEVPRGHRGLNAPHVRDLAAQLAAGSWLPDLQRMERLQSAEQMRQVDYAEAWAWVHLLLETEPAAAELLRKHLATLRFEATSAPLSQAIREHFEQPEAALADHVRKLAMSLALSG